MIYIGGDNIEREIKKLNEEFLKIKEKGWIKSLNNGSNGIGFTFESLLGIPMNELEIPDYNGIELKTRRYSSTSYIILFSSKPEGKYYHEVERIKDIYGYPHSKFKEYNVLNNSVYGNRINRIGQKFYFKLDVDRVKRKIYLVIYNKDKSIIERDVYWDFDILEEKLYRKMKVLAIIKAYSKKKAGWEYFKYDLMQVYYLKNFEAVINLIEEWVIRVNYKLNVKTKGDKIGHIHDHGTSFDILEKDIEKLYKLYDIM